jgi:hypothetical protein
VADDDPTMQRLEDQIKWYDSRSLKNQRIFKVLKMVVILAAALIPFLVGLNVPKWIIGGLGILIAVIEGLQQMNQYHPNWITYRSTCEALKHEKFLYFAKQILNSSPKIKCNWFSTSGVIFEMLVLQRK